jgi:hypothetical protein
MTVLTSADLKTIHLTCNCGGKDHYISIEREDDKFTADPGPEFFVYLCVGGDWLPFWRRLWRGLKYIVRAERTIIGDVVLSRADIKEVYSWIGRHTYP